jgi:hypothetical protein
VQLGLGEEGGRAIWGWVQAVLLISWQTVVLIAFWSFSSMLVWQTCAHHGLLMRGLPRWEVCHGLADFLLWQTRKSDEQIY